MLAITQAEITPVELEHVKTCERRIQKPKVKLSATTHTHTHKHKLFFLKMEVNNEHVALLLDDNQTNRSRASSHPSDHRMDSPHSVAESGSQSFRQWAIWRPIVGLCLTMVN